MKKLFILLATLIGLLTSCSKEDRELTQPAAEPANSSASVPDYLNPNYVSIDWSNSDVLSYDLENGLFSIKMSGAIPEIVKGSVLTIDADTTGCVCIVNTCSINDDVVTVSGTVGSLYDVFGNTELILSTEEIPAETMTKASAGSVIIGVPTAVITKNDKGENEIHEFVNTKAYQYSLNCGFNTTSTYKYGALTLTSNTNLSSSLGLYLDIKFKGIGIIPKYVEMYVQGNAGVSQKLDIDVSRKFNKSDEKTIASVSMSKVKFKVLGIPIYISLCADLNLLYQANVTAKASLSTGYSENLSVKCGFKWDNGVILPINSCTNKCTIYSPTLTCSASGTAKIYVYPSFYAQVSDILKASFDVMPYLSATAIDNNLNSYWDLNIQLGVDMRAKLSIAKKTWEINKADVYKKNTSYKIYK